MDSYAQNNEDVVLWRALGHVDAGTYVDVGAADPVIDSVTKAFYDSGWSGVNVEPVTALAHRLREQRERDTTVQAAAGAAAGRLTLHQVADTGLSTLDDDAAAALASGGYEVEDVEVDIVPLNDIIHSAGLGDGPIHFLKIDVEGAERDVLLGLDLARCRPWIVVVEATAPQSVRQTADEWHHLLADADYRFTLFDGLNRFYVAAEHDELVPLVSYPACVFDQPFFTRPHREALTRIDELVAGAAAISAEYDKAIEAYGEVERKLSDTVDGYGRIEAEYQAALEGYARLEEEYRNTLDSYQRLEAEHNRVVASCQAHREQADAQLATLRAGVVEMSTELDQLRAITVEQIETRQTRRRTPPTSQRRR